MNRTERIAQFKRLLEERIVILDGAMGTMLQREKFEEEDFRGERFRDHSSDLKGNNDILSLTQPDAVRRVHEAYLAAGADVIETNTFNGNAPAQADYNLESIVYELNRAGARLAREAADTFEARDPSRPRFVC
ncbi:MAG: homocysteine S-methyltransferase family protein, partial [Myxococcota bacterium]